MEEVKTINDIVAEMVKLVDKNDKRAKTADKHLKKVVDRERKPMGYCGECGRMLTNPITGKLKPQEHICR